MLDINLIRENPEKIRAALLKKVDELDFTKLLEWDRQRRELIVQADELKAKRNEVSAQVPTLKKEGRDITNLVEEMKVVGENIARLDTELREVENKVQEFMRELPNIPDEDVPVGGKENNEVVRAWGEKPSFDFEPKDHIELCESLGLIDYERAAKMSGAGYWCYTGDGALLEWALLNYFIEFHNNNGYKFILPPAVLTEESAYVSGHLPKFRDDLFWTQDNTCLNATAEMMMGNYHRDEILSGGDLPLKYYAFATSFRREAGSYRKEERGMIRGHQFNKVEMFQFTTPEKSGAALEEMISHAENLVEGLGLHFQISKLATRDCSAAMAKTYDIEVWIPSMGVYKEVSSASNARNYQARRGNVRFKNENGKNEFAHTLNASGLATSRIFPAIVEQFQQEDGSVIVPAVLRKWVGKDVIKNQK